MKTVECRICKKEFRVYQCIINRGGGKYCSRKCFFKSITKKGNKII